ncbi:MAG TPA: beta-N-acetylhexosaminidase [Pyrinomonadaceae bacterium]|nr:beta-N-acetylhexosaminidase [Pyrinomonadaceae bacterium]
MRLNNSSDVSAGRRAALCMLAALTFVAATSPRALASRAYSQTPEPKQAKEEGERVQVIPEPKSVTKTGEDFPLTKEVRVVLADSKSEEDRFAAQDFIDDARETAGVELRLGSGGGKRRILVGLLTSTLVREALESAGASAPQDLSDEGYVLTADARGVVVAGKTAAGTFYGLQTLKQLVRGEGAKARVQGVRINDWPAMRWRAVSDDISRGPVPTLEYFKRQIRTEAMFKLNMHSLYMEHVLRYDSHPLIAPDGGALTPAEVRELVAYARRYHVELVPEQQTFGHMHKALKLEKYNELSEVPYGDVMTPKDEGTYKLVADMYKELDPLFPGEFFHIGADETFELGRGRAAEDVKARGIGPVYFDHLKRVRELLQPYKRRLMFWGDIALNHPDLLPSVPRDMIAMNWDYSPKPSYEARIGLFKKAGLEQFVCPGVQSWNQIFPNTDAATVNVVNFVRDGQRAGALGMMNTQWDDDGESLFEMDWHGVVLGAAASWQDLRDAQTDTQAVIDGFDRDFDWAFFRHEGEELTEATRALGGANALLEINNSDDLFWRDPFTDDFQETIARGKGEKTKQLRLDAEEAEEAVERERANVRRNRSTLDVMSFAARRFDHMGRRAQVLAQMSRDYWDAYLNLNDRRQVRRLRSYSGAIYNSLREMSEELTALREEYRELWLKENRPYWLASVLARYDLAAARWLARSKQVEEALREYDRSSTLPPPAEFGLGPRPEQNQKR